MARNIKYVSLDTVFSKLYRDMGVQEISEIDVVEWCGEALELIGAVKLYEESVDIIKIKNHQAELPNWLHSIIQVAKIIDYKEKENITLEESNTDSIQIIIDYKPCDCEDTLPKPLGITCNCSKTWFYNNFKNGNLKPIRLANHSFFNSLVCNEDLELYNSFCCNDEYTIVDNKIRTSFKEGTIALAYYKQKVDKKTGFPLIPDSVDIITALSWYVTYKYCLRLWFKHREGYGDKIQYAESQWQWYCKQASTNLMMIYGIDEHQNFLEDRFNLIPKRDKYYSFFGKLGRSQNLKFKHTNVI